MVPPGQLPVARKSSASPCDLLLLSHWCHQCQGNQVGSTHSASHSTTQRLRLLGAVPARHTFCPNHSTFQSSRNLRLSQTPHNGGVSRLACNGGLSATAAFLASPVRPLASPVTAASRLLRRRFSPRLLRRPLACYGGLLATAAFLPRLLRRHFLPRLLRRHFSPRLLRRHFLPRLRSCPGCAPDRKKGWGGKGGQGLNHAHANVQNRVKNRASCSTCHAKNKLFHMSCKNHAKCGAYGAPTRRTLTVPAFATCATCAISHKASH